MNIEKGLKHLKQKDKKMRRVIAKFEKPEFKKDLNYFPLLHYQDILYLNMSLSYQ